MKMVSDVLESLSTVANSTVTNKLLVIYILHSFTLGQSIKSNEFLNNEFGALNLYLKLLRTKSVYSILNVNSSLSAH